MNDEIYDVKRYILLHPFWPDAGRQQALFELSEFGLACVLPEVALRRINVASHTLCVVCAFAAALG
jgi:hypothetical protein